mgnify:CR=1 FL=1
MKKLLSILCAAALTLSLAACGSSATENYAGQTLTGQVTAIDGSAVTLQLGELAEDTNTPPDGGSDAQTPPDGGSDTNTPPEKPGDASGSDTQTPPDGGSDDPDVVVLGIHGELQRLVVAAHDVAAVPGEVGVAGDDDVAPVLQGLAAGEGLQGLAAQDHGAAHRQVPETLHVGGQVEEQAAFPADGPVSVNSSDGIHRCQYSFS